MGSLNLSLVLTLAPVLLVPHLGDRSFRARERAHRQLAGYGALARPALELARGHPDPEVRRRAQQLRAPWAEEVADAKSRRILPRDYPRLPWLDYQVVGWPAYNHWMAEAHKSELKDTERAWPIYQEATRLWVRSQIYQKRPRREILDVLDDLVTAERVWIRDVGASYSPPIDLPRGAAQR